MAESFFVFLRWSQGKRGGGKRGCGLPSHLVGGGKEAFPSPLGFWKIQNKVISGACPTCPPAVGDGKGQYEEENVPIPRMRKEKNCALRRFCTRGKIKVETFFSILVVIFNSVIVCVLQYFSDSQSDIY